MTDKLCPRCFQIKPIEEFRRSRCKLCNNFYSRELRQRHKDAAEDVRQRSQNIPALNIVSNFAGTALNPIDQFIVPQLTSVFEQIDRMRGRA